MIQITAMPQSRACIERTFSKINNNITKLHNQIAIYSMEAIVKVREQFPTNFEVDKQLASFHANTRSSYEKDKERS